ncbi:MAG: glycerophosphodiester phosphodiesterase [Gammaproteobacteria bacterium]|nr:glycerophosphodiester phosphodiesterase [Gammaproteobacteria bacterium]
MIELAKFIAHRGASAVAPENTLIALQKAAELGAKWVEFDVQLSGDQVPVIMHDYNLKRTTDREGFVNQISLEKLKTLDAGSWFDAKFAGEKVPTLIEYVKLIAELNMGMNIELKTPACDARLAAECVAMILDQYWPDDLSKVLVSSGVKANLVAVKQVAPQLSMGLIQDHWSWRLIANLKKLDCLSVHLNHRCLTEKRVKKLKQANFLVLAYTVNDLKRAEELFTWGVEAVFSDKLV